MTGRFLGLGVIVAVLAGCVPIPIPVVGSTDSVDVPPALSSPMAAGDKVAILGTDLAADEMDYVSCVQSAAARADPALTIIAPRDFRDAVFPWFDRSTLPGTVEQLAISISDPAVKAKLAELDVRYVVVVTLSTIESANEEFGIAALGFGGEKWTRRSRIWGDILDLKEARMPGKLALEASGTGSWTVVAYLAAPITIPATESPACNEFGRQLAAYLTGRPAPKPKAAAPSG